MNALPTFLLRGLWLPLLVGLLSGCTVYDRVFHPHRLPTPPMSATAKAKARAAEKARHKGTSLKAAEEAPDAASTDATTPAAADEKKPMSYSDLPAGTRLKYDKQGLVKKSTLDRLEANRRKLHYYDTRPLKPREASRENRRLRKHSGKNHGKGATKEPKDQLRSRDMPAEPAPDPTQPTDPTPAPTPAKVKGKKVAVPKPDPTQPAPAGSH